MNLLPLPQFLSLNDVEMLPLPDALRVCCQNVDKPYVALFISRLETHLGLSLPVSYVSEGRNLRILREAGHCAGWYRLDLRGTGISLFCGENEGLGHALVTLFHLFREGGLPLGLIEDWPKYPYRGQLLDTVRHFFGIDEIKKMIEQLSLLKFNRLHWVFANDQAWRLQSPSYPKLTERWGKEIYTRAQVRELVDYAKLRGVEIVPEFEIPGHSSAAIAAYPELCCAGSQIVPPTTGGVFPYILCAGKDSTYDFIKAILGEILTLFPGPFIHLGGDEAPKVEWKTCPHCAEKMRQLGLSRVEDLQSHIMNFALKILKAHGRHGICWNECLLNDGLSMDFTVQFWSDMAKPGFCAKHINSGRKFILSDLIPFYFDYPHSFSNLKTVYRFRPNIGGKPVPEEAVAGIESTIWTERIDNAQGLERLLFPRAAAAAELAWGTTGDYPGFIQRLRSYYTIFAACGVEASSIEAAEISGLKRLWQNIRFAGSMIIFVSTINKSQKQIRACAAEAEGKRRRQK